MPPSIVPNPDLIQLDSDHTLADGQIVRYVAVDVFIDFGYEPDSDVGPEMHVRWHCYNENRRLIENYNPARFTLGTLRDLLEEGSNDAGETAFAHLKRSTMARINGATF